MGGLAALNAVPCQEFGPVSTVDRGEIEDLRCLQTIIREYADAPPSGRPLSIAVFGAPGGAQRMDEQQAHQPVEAWDAA